MTTKTRSRTAAALRPAITLALLALVLLAPAPLARADAGDLDPTFDGDGKRVLSYGGADFPAEVLVQPDGKLLVAGYGTSGVDFTLSRLNPDGSPDAGFDGDGTAVADFGSNDHVAAAALQPGGEIILAGSTNGRMAVARFRPDGSLDASFDPGGLDGPGKKIFGENDPASAAAMVVQRDGRIVLAGARPYQSGSDDDFALVRLNPDGSSDGTGFDLGDFLGGYDYPQAAAVQPDGKILVAGIAGVPAGLSRLAVARYTAAGSLDPTFAGDGALTFGSGETVGAAAVEAQPDGKIVVAGTGEDDFDMLVARLQPDGSFDAGFGNRGTSAFSFFGVELGLAAVLQPDGTIVAAGATIAPGMDVDFAVARLLPGGALDTTFSSDGKATVNFGAAEAASAVARQPDGKIVLAGVTEANQNIAVARLQADPPLAGDGPPAGRPGVPPPPPVPAPRCAGRRATIVGTAGRDVLRGARRADVIVGLGGNDVIRARQGADRVCAGSGNDTLTGGSGRDLLDGGAGRDKLDGGFGRDRLRGGAQRDACVGGRHRDQARSCERSRSI